MRMTDLGFEDWLDFTFGRPVRSDFVPFFDDREAFWDPPAAVGVDYLTRLFEAPAATLGAYDDRQLGGGFWLLVSEDAHCVYSRDVPAAARERCLAATATLFANIFDARCAPVLGHLDRTGGQPLNSACYMWWDIWPGIALGDDPDRERLEQAALGAMEKTLRLANPACQESALHGLGHWVRSGPDRVDTIIGDYLDGGAAGAALTAYARAARSGCIQ